METPPSALAPGVLPGGPGSLSPNPKGIESVSLGLRGTCYPRKSAPDAFTLKGLYRPP
jgi:hypothetical protein